MEVEPLGLHGFQPLLQLIWRAGPTELSLDNEVVGGDCFQHQPVFAPGHQDKEAEGYDVEKSKGK